MHRVVMRACSDDEGDLYVIDLCIGADGKPKAGIIYFGVWGKARDEGERFPFVLTMEGVIDLGVQTGPTHTRFHRTNLRDRSISKNEYVTVWRREIGDDEDEEITFVITEIVVPGEGP